MTLQGVFLCDGPSDLPLARVLEDLSSDVGELIALTAIDPRLMPRRDATVAGRLASLRENRIEFDLAFVHRDAEREPAESRRAEIASGAEAAGVTEPVVPVVPVRMTEAWLLLDEQAIREVAGRPSGSTPLDLPKRAAVERAPDPKDVLKAALATAAELSGRRARQFQRDFGRHRALLLERLDIHGPVRQLTAWKQLRADIERALTQIGRTQP